MLQICWIEYISSELLRHFNNNYNTNYINMFTHKQKYGWPTSIKQFKIWNIICTQISSNRNYAVWKNSKRLVNLCVVCGCPHVHFCSMFKMGFQSHEWVLYAYTPAISSWHFRNVLHEISNVLSSMWWTQHFYRHFWSHNSRA